jgi:hypothetical protein
LERGAAIPYNGLEVKVSRSPQWNISSHLLMPPRKVDTYEVLVPALQPFRYAFSNTVHMPRIPRILGDSPCDRAFERLKYCVLAIAPFYANSALDHSLIKTVVLVDDSLSVRNFISSSCA